MKLATAAATWAAFAALTTTPGLAPTPGAASDPAAWTGPVAAPLAAAPAGIGSVEAGRLPLCTDLPSLPTARCGSIVVPLDREDASAGTTTVAYAVLPHTDRASRSLGTIVPNPGGPGTGTIELGFAFAQALQPLLARRDLLLVDPRGVGRSTALTCPAFSGSAKAFASLQEQRRLIGDCGRQLGVRARYYGSAAVADDVDDVRSVLGLQQLDLFGVSYGTFLMPTYAQRHPKHVRTVSLAGAYAVNIPTVGTPDVAAFRRAVGLVCARTDQCDGRTVLADLAVLADRLRARPASVDVDYGGKTHHVVLDEWQMTTTAAAVYTNVPDTATELALAAAARSGRSGDLGPFRALVRARVIAAASALDQVPGHYSEALNWATSCHDYPRDFDYADGPAARVADYRRSVARFDAADFAPFTPRTWVSRSDYDTGACLQWPQDPTARAPFPAGTRLPDVPVLVLNGDLDANTSTASAREAAAQFRHATLVEVPGAGHTPASTAEGAALLVRFIARGRA